MYNPYNRIYTEPLNVHLQLTTRNKCVIA